MDTQPTKRCRTCGGDLIQKSVAVLSLVGSIIIGTAIAVIILAAVYWVAVVLLLLVGFYLVFWGIFGKGLWCRQCKKPPFF